jgi:hypothetical protein
LTPRSNQNACTMEEYGEAAALSAFVATTEQPVTSQDVAFSKLPSHWPVTGGCSLAYVPNATVFVRSTDTALLRASGSVNEARGPRQPESFKCSTSKGVRRSRNAQSLWDHGREVCAGLASSRCSVSTAA